MLTTDDQRRAARRTRIYCILLAVASSMLFFTALGQRRMSADEAQYALCAEIIRASHEWLDITPYPPQPYLHRPPLYMWLSAATLDWIRGPVETKFRVWSAAFGVGCVVLTCALGASLFASPEIGLIAAILLMTNRKFVTEHGVRQGVFDPALTFFTLAAVLLLWMRYRGRIDAAIAWIGIGISAGLMCLFKPLAGVPVLALLALCIALMPTARKRRMFGGLLVALLVMIAVAAPWYVAMYARHGSLFTHEMFGNNLVGRIASASNGNRQNPFFYFTHVPESSPAFWLAIPAIIWLIAKARHDYAVAARVVLVFAMGWIVLFSLSASKAIHYIYPALPFCAVAIAAAFMDLLSIPRLRPLLAMIGAIVLGLSLGVTMQEIAYDSSRTYAPCEIFREFSPQIESGKMDVALVGLPRLEPAWRTEAKLNSTDHFYLREIQRRGALMLDALPRGVARPTLLIIAKRTADRAELASLRAQLDPLLTWENDVLLVTPFGNARLTSPRPQHD